MIFGSFARLLDSCRLPQGKPFCGCWVHNAFVNVDGEKMSKSKGNFLTLKGTLATALDVRAFRYLVVSSQYRTTLGFSTKSLEGAKNTVQRLDKLRVRGGRGVGRGRTAEGRLLLSGVRPIVGRGGTLRPRMRARACPRLTSCYTVLVFYFYFCVMQVALEAAAAAAAAGEETEGGDADEVSPELRESVPQSLKGFDAGMNDDLNTPR